MGSHCGVGTGSEKRGVTVTVIAHAQGTTSSGARDVDTIRALCHDLRQPLAAILLLAGAESGDPARKLAGIAEQARWLADLVDDVLVEAAGDGVEQVDVATSAELVASRARPTAECDIAVWASPGAVAMARPVAIGRAIGCLVDNAVRAAGPGGHVEIIVADSGDEIVVTVTDDGPGLGQVTSRTSLGLGITRALVASCRGGFDLRSGTSGGAVATVRLLRAAPQAVAS